MDWPSATTKQMKSTAKIAAQEMKLSGNASIQANASENHYSVMEKKIAYKDLMNKIVQFAKMTMKPCHHMRSSV